MEGSDRGPPQKGDNCGILWCLSKDWQTSGAAPAVCILVGKISGGGRGTRGGAKRLGDKERGKGVREKGRASSR